MKRTIIPILFHPEKQVSAQEQGEGGMTVLACRLPRDLRGAAHGWVTFYIGKAKKQYAWPAESNPNIVVQDNEIWITLWPELTADRFLRVQIKGVLPDGATPETPLSELIRFAPGSGAYVESPPGMLEEILSVASHDNRPILDALSEDEAGALCYNGDAYALAAALEAEAATRADEDETIREDVAPLSNVELEALINLALAAL